MSALAKAALVGSAGLDPRGLAVRASPVEAVRSPARIGARLADADAQPGRSAEAKAPPAARTRLAATVRPAAQPEGITWGGGSSAFLAQRLAQETLPEALDETPLQQRAGYAAYAAASGRFAVLGPAGSGIGLRI
jgi:hypothetical protein